MTLKEARECAGLNQKMAAARIGVTDAAIVGWEKGKFSPMPTKFQKIGEVYGLTMRQVYEIVRGKEGAVDTETNGAAGADNPA